MNLDTEDGDQDNDQSDTARTNVGPNTTKRTADSLDEINSIRTPFQFSYGALVLSSRSPRANVDRINAIVTKRSEATRERRHGGYNLEFVAISAKWRVYMSIGTGTRAAHGRPDGA